MDRFPLKYYFYSASYMAAMNKKNTEDLEERWPKNSFKDDRPGKKVLLNNTAFYNKLVTY